MAEAVDGYGHTESCVELSLLCYKSGGLQAAVFFFILW